MITQLINLFKNTPTTGQDVADALIGLTYQDKKILFAAKTYNTSGYFIVLDGTPDSWDHNPYATSIDHAAALKLIAEA